MPQDVIFEIPIKARRNPHREVAARHNLSWLHRHGMLRSDAAEEVYRSWELADLAAGCWPEATAEDLGLTLDLKAFYFLFDDQFDGPQGEDATSVMAVCGDLIAIAHQEPVRPSSPVTSAFTDLWARSRQGMSSSWVARAACDWERYFAAYPHELLRRHTREVPGIGDYFHVRRGSAATESVTDMIERINRAEVPPLAFHSPLIRRMRQIAAEVPFICNDVYSYEKESTRGDVYNLVTVLMHQDDCTLPEALARIQAMAADQIHTFLDLRKHVRRLASELLLPDGKTRHLTRYVTGLGDWLRGHNDWMNATPRYRTEFNHSAARPGYAEGLLAW